MVAVRVLLLLGLFCSVRAQDKVDNRVFAWLGSDVVLSCSVRVSDVKQITLKRKENGQSVDFLTYGEVSGMKKLTRFAEERVDFLGNGHTDGSIRIRNVALADESLYTCIFTVFPSGAYHNTTFLTVLAKPAILEPPPEPVIPKLQFQTVAVCVAGAAKPAANITWRTGGLDYRSSAQEVQHANRTVTTQSRLDVMAGVGINNHSVTCVISQDGGITATRTERDITIHNIHYPPNSVYVEVKTLDSGNIQFTCKEDSSPPATNFTWKRRDTFSSDDVEMGIGRTLSIKNFPDGLYICEAENSIGKSSGYIYLYRPPVPSACLHGCLWPVLIVFLLWVALLLYYFKYPLIKTREKPEKGAPREFHFEEKLYDFDDPSPKDSGHVSRHLGWMPFTMMEGRNDPKSGK